MSPILLVASILFGIVLLFFAIYGFFLVYHLFEFSLNRVSAFVLVGVFVGISVVLLFTISIYLFQVNWSGSLFSFF